MRERLQSLIDTFFCSVDIDKFYEQDQKEKLAKWLFENGVIVPPCKVGDKVYTLLYNEIDEGVVVSCEYSQALGFSYMSSNGKFPTLFKEENIGKTVFLTREEAKAKLKGGGE